MIDVVMIIGPSGTGKTRLSNIIKERYPYLTYDNDDPNYMSASCYNIIKEINKKRERFIKENISFIDNTINDSILEGRDLIENKNVNLIKIYLRTPARKMQKKIDQFLRRNGYQSILEFKKWDTHFNKKTDFEFNMNDEERVLDFLESRLKCKEN